jgi:tetratricopeptide (TPR) repeat protein
MEESLVVYRRVGDQPGIAQSLFLLGLVANRLRGDYKTARRLSEESLAIYRQLGDQSGIAGTLFSLGDASRLQREYETARAFYQEAVAISLEAGHWTRMVEFLGVMGQMEREAGEYARSAVCYRECMAYRQLVDIPFIVPGGLKDFANLAGLQGHWERAVRLLSAAREAVQPSEGSIPDALPEEEQRIVDGARAALGEEGFAAAWAAGRSLSLEEAVVFALEGRLED